MTWYWDQEGPEQGIDYELTYLRAAQGVTGGSVTVGTSVVLDNYQQWQQGAWSFPAYSASDGTTGYEFQLTATMVPEPASMVPLLAGLVALALRVRRRP